MPTTVLAFNEEVDKMYRTFSHLPKLGLAVCIGVIACLSFFAQLHSPGTVSAAQTAPISDDSLVITPTFGIFLPLVTVNKLVPLTLPPPPPPCGSAAARDGPLAPVKRLTSGTTAADIAGFPTNGTHVNGPVPVPGGVAGGLSFDGIDDYVE